MKVLAVLLVCAVAAHGRSPAVDQVNSGRPLADISESPWTVHLRVAVSTSGFLETSIGSLVTSSFVLTTADRVKDARFIFIRLGGTNVIHPELVIETAIVQIQPPISSPADPLALVSLNRIIQFTDNISPVALAVKPEVPESVKFYIYGDDGADGPGEQLSSINVSLHPDELSITAFSEEGRASRFDIGAPLVSEGVQFAVLTAANIEDSAGIFQRLNEDDLVWIKGQTGL